MSIEEVFYKERSHYMYYIGRDQSIDLIRARKGHACYGMGLGIMILDEVYPGFPGDVRNASAYPFRFNMI